MGLAGGESHARNSDLTGKRELRDARGFAGARRLTFPSESRQHPPSYAISCRQNSQFTTLESSDALRSWFLDQ